MDHDTGPAPVETADLPPLIWSLSMGLCRGRPGAVSGDFVHELPSSVAGHLGHRASLQVTVSMTLRPPKNHLDVMAVRVPVRA